MIFVFVLCVLLAILSLITSKNNIFSPGVITSTIWIVVLGLFWILHHNLPPLSWQFLGSLSIWILLIILGSNLMQSVEFKVTNYEPSQFVRDLFFWLSLISYPFFLIYIKEALATGESGNWAMDLRLAALGETERFKEVYGGMQIILWQVTYLIELFYFSRKNRNRVFILGIFFLSFGFLTMAKSIFLDFAIKTIVVLFFKKKVSIKHFLLSIGVLLSIFFLIQTLRFSKDYNDDEKNDIIVLYSLSSSSAFDTLIPSSSEQIGENVFRFYYAVSNKMGFSDKEPIEPILPFIEKPIFTNTYTGMYPFFKDFGFWGVGFFSLLYGFLFGWIFKKAQKNSSVFILIYATISSVIVMQYVADLLITNLASYIKQILLILLPFIAGKYKIFSIHNFNQITQ